MTKKSRDFTDHGDYFNCIFEYLYPDDHSSQRIILSDGELIDRSI